MFMNKNKITFEDKNIILFHFTKLGDLIWMTSVFSLIKSYDKNIKITLVTSMEYFDIINDDKYIDRCILFKRKLFDSKYTVVRYIYKIYFSLKNFFVFTKYKTAIFMDVELSMTLITKYLFGIKNIYGPSLLMFGDNLKNKSSMFYSQTINVKNFNDYLHHMMRYQTIIRSIFPIYNLSKPQISENSYPSKKIKDLFKTEKLRIAICPSGSVSYRNLKKDFLRNLVLKINSEYKAVLFLFIGNENKEYKKVEEIKKELNDIDIINLCTKTTLQDLKYISKNVNLIVSIDTSIVHIAAVYNTPTIAIYSSSAPEHSLGVNHNLIPIYKKQNCSPCDVQQFVKKIKCKYKSCIALDKVSVDEVFFNIQKILE